MDRRRVASCRATSVGLGSGLQADTGRISVSTLTAEFGCSRKRLTVRFWREFGVALKLSPRVLRFSHVM